MEVTHEVEDVACWNDGLDACGLVRRLCATEPCCFQHPPVAAARPRRSCGCAHRIAQGEFETDRRSGKNWPAYEAALRNLAKLRVERFQEQKSADPIKLLRQRADDLGAASAALKQLADAEEPLLNSLDDAQKKQLATFARIARERRAKLKG